MKNLLTKKNILILSLSGTILVVLFGMLGMESCYRNTTCKMFRDWLSFESFSSSILFLPLFLFSLITYRMRDEIFETWVKFTLWWSGVTIILVILAPADDPSLLPITKLVVALASTAVLTIISSALVLWKRSMLKVEN